MDKANQHRVEKRNIGRRKEDLETWERNLRYQQLLSLGQTITSEMNMDALFQLIMDQTNQIMNTERSTIFLADRKKEELWSLVATGMGKNEIRIPHDSGVAGWVYQNRKPLAINDPYNDERFNLGVDKQSGFVTRNLLCVPVVNRNGQCIGVLQALNSHMGRFSKYDTRILESIADYVAIAVENAQLYEEVKAYSEKLKASIIQNENLEKAKAHLTKFVPTSVAKLVDQDPDQLNGEKVPMDVSVLFLDIQGFSSITEGYDQRQVNDMVESHFSQYLNCIGRHGGGTERNHRGRFDGNIQKRHGPGSCPGSCFRRPGNYHGKWPAEPGNYLPLGGCGSAYGDQLRASPCGGHPHEKRYRRPLDLHCIRYGNGDGSPYWCALPQNKTLYRTGYHASG